MDNNSSGNLDSRASFPGELQRSRLAPFFLALYRALDCERRWRLGRAILRLLLRMEGGPFFTATVREILERHHGVKIGAYSYGACLEIGRFPPGITVGRYVSTGYAVYVYPQNHPLDRLSMHPFFYDKRLGLLAEDALPAGKLEIGHDAWIGNHVVITHGCKRIGIGAVVGAGAVVTRDVPDFAIVAGNPAKLIRYRFDEPTRYAILASCWWERPIEDLRRNLSDMLLPIPPDACRHPLLSPSEPSSRQDTNLNLAASSREGASDLFPTGASY